MVHTGARERWPLGPSWLRRPRQVTGSGAGFHVFPPGDRSWRRVLRLPTQQSLSGPCLSDSRCLAFSGP